MTTNPEPLLANCTFSAAAFAGHRNDEAITQVETRQEAVAKQVAGKLSIAISYQASLHR
jgi:hypothetical protein